jgi:hypothetical protein
VNGLNTAFSKSFKRIRQFKLNVRLKKEDIINFSKAKISYYTKKIFLYLLLLNLSYVFIYPVIHMVITSFKDMQDFMDITVRWIPNRLFSENYTIALTMLDYKTGFFNSFIITVFIDTRTGINQWGAFPLLGFADQIVLVAYPNEENVEGLTNIIELMQKVGLDNYVVAMSKFEDDDKGINIAKEYFDKLKDIKQEFLGIGYMSSADMIGKYPFLDNLEPYKALSDYISESEIVKFNVKFLSKVNVVEILKHIKRCFSNAEDIIKDETLKTDISLLKKGEQEAELTEEGIRKLVMELLDSSIFNEYIDAILESKDIFKCLSNVNGSSGSSGSTQTEDIKEGVNENLPARECVIRQKILDLFWGIRVSAKRYCKPVSLWFCNELKNISEEKKANAGGNKSSTVNKSMVVITLNKALEIEIESRQRLSMEGSNAAKFTNGFAKINAEEINDRMLNIESILSACAWYASNKSV